MIANGPEKGKIHLCPGSQYYLHCEEQEKIVLARMLQMKLFVLLPFPMFVESGYVQHAGAEYFGHPNLRYNVCFVL